MADQDLTISIGATTGELRAELSKAETALKAITAELANFKGMAAGGTPGVGVQNAIKALGDEADKTRTQIGELRDALRDTGGASEAFTASSTQRTGAIIRETEALRARQAAALEDPLSHLPTNQRQILSASGSAAVLGTSLSAAAAADAFARDSALAVKAAEAEKMAAIAAAAMTGEQAAQKILGYSTNSKSAAESAAVFSKEMKILSQSEVATSLAQQATATEQFAKSLVGANTDLKAAAESAQVFQDAEAAAIAAVAARAGAVESRSSITSAVAAYTGEADILAAADAEAKLVAGRTAERESLSAIAAAEQAYKAELGAATTATVVAGNAANTSAGLFTRWKAALAGGATVPVSAAEESTKSIAAAAAAFDSVTARAPHAGAASHAAANEFSIVGAASRNAGLEIQHFSAIADDVMRGQTSRIGASVLPLLRDSGILQTIFSTLAGPWGLVTAGIAAAAAGMGYLLYQTIEYAQAVREVGAGNLLSGQGNTQTAEEITAAVDKVAEAYDLTYRSAKHVVAAFAEVTGMTAKQRDEMISLAAAQATLKGTDVAKEAEAVVKAYGGTGKAAADAAEKAQLITKEEKANLDTLGDMAERSAVLDLVAERFDKVAGAAARAKADAERLSTILTVMQAPELAMPGGPLEGMWRAMRPGVAPSPGEETNAQTALRRFQQELNLSREQAAGLVGVLQQESGTELNPASSNNIGGGHVGLPNWSMERAKALGITASSSLDEQISAIIKELQTTESNALAKIKGAMSPQAAAAAAVSYERPEGYGPNDPRKAQLAAYTARAEAAAQALIGQQAQTRAEKDGADAVLAGSKAKEDQLRLEHQISDAQGVYQKTLQQIDAAEAAGNTDLANTLRLQAQEQANAIKNLELKQGAVHDQGETDRHATIMRNLQTEAQQFGLSDQQILSIAQRQAQEIASYGRYSASARAEADSVLAAAMKKISDEDLRDQLHNMQLELETERGATAEKLANAQKEYDAIIKIKGVRDPSAQAKELEVIRLKNELEDQATQRQITALRTELAKVPPIEKQLELKKQINALEAQIAAHTGGGIASATGKQALADAEAESQYRQQSFQERMHFADAVTRADEREIAAEKAKLDAQVANRTLTTQEAAQKLAEVTERTTEEAEKQYLAIAEKDGATVDEKERAYDKIIQLAARASEQEQQLAARSANAQSRSADTIAKAFEGGFNSAGNALSSFVEAGVERTETLQQAFVKLVNSLTSSLIKELGTASSQLLANALGGKEGQGIGGVLASKIGGLIGLGSGGPANTAQTVAGQAAAKQLDVMGDATAKVTSLLGLHAAAATLNTTTTGVNTLSTTANTIATNSSTVADEAHAAEAGAGGALGAGGSILKAIPLIGGLFEQGGIVPSAAGGFLVPAAATYGGQISILHPKEMVLPAHISEGIQSMLGSSGRANTNSANLTYAPVINGGTPFMTRSSVETMLRAHGGTFESFAKNLVGNFR